MSLFSEILEKYIHESGVTIYKLALDSGINRTAIHKYLSGERLPKEKALTKLVKYLNLTESEQTKLLNEYLIANIGKELYLQRLYVKQVIHSLYQLNKIKQSLLILQSSIVPFKDITKTQLYKGSFLIIQIIKSLVENEANNQLDPTIFFNLQPDQILLDQLFIGLDKQKENKIKIKHLIYFQKLNSKYYGNNLNLKLLTNILPQLLLTEYHVYYYYDYIRMETDSSILFPYYIIFSNVVVSISNDLNTAKLDFDYDTIQHYRDCFLNRLKNTQKLTHESYNTISLLDHFTNYNSPLDFYCFLDYEPSILLYYAQNLKTTLVNEHQAFEELILKRYNQLLQVKDLRFLFHKNGLDNFVETGCINPANGNNINQLTYVERIEILNRLYNDCNADKRYLRIVNPLDLPICNNISIIFNGNQELCFYIFDNDTLLYNYIGITENTTVETFTDFIKSTHNSSYLYSKEETLELIRQKIDILNQRFLVTDTVYI